MKDNQRAGKCEIRILSAQDGNIAARDLGVFT